MPANREAPLRQQPLPPRARADRCRLVEQAVLLFLPGAALVRPVVRLLIRGLRQEHGPRQPEDAGHR